jgi:hypothetical protein
MLNHTSATEMYSHKLNLIIHLGIQASVTDLDSTVWVNYELLTLIYC